MKNLIFIIITLIVISCTTSKPSPTSFTDKHGDVISIGEGGVLYFNNRPFKSDWVELEYLTDTLKHRRIDVNGDTLNSFISTNSSSIQFNKNQIRIFNK